MGDGTGVRQEEHGLALLQSCKSRSCDRDVGSLRGERWVWRWTWGADQKEPLGMQQQVTREGSTDEALQKEVH